MAWGLTSPRANRAFLASPRAPTPFNTIPADATPALITGLNNDTTGLLAASPPPTLCPSLDAAFAPFSPNQRRVCPSLFRMMCLHIRKEKLIPAYVPGSPPHTQVISPGPQLCARRGEARSRHVPWVSRLPFAGDRHSTWHCRVPKIGLLTTKNYGCVRRCSQEVY